MHTDEAVNASIVADGLDGSGYRYDPRDRHGPSLYYLCAPICAALGVHRLADMEAWQLRLGIALVSAASLAPLALILGTGEAVLASAALLAFGAPFLFYGRYALHEPILVFATFLAIGSGWRFWTTGRLSWAMLLGSSLALAQCTKETAVIGFAAAAVALAICRLHGPTRRAFGQARAGSLTRSRLGRGAALAIACGLAVAVAGYSSLGQHPQGLLDAVRAIPLQIDRASGQGHAKPWSTYLQWLLEPSPLALPWFGWTLAILASVGAASAFSTGTEPLVRFLCFLALATLALYCAIPYKTPWLILNIVAPLALVAGHGAARLWALCGQSLARRILAGGLAALALGLMLRESYRLCFAYTEEPHNPFAYSPSAPDLNRLASTLSSFSRGGKEPVVYVAATDYWPLPWYLRKIHSVGFWNQLPSDLACDVLITSPDLAPQAEARLGGAWRREYFGLRSDVLVFLYHR